MFLFYFVFPPQVHNIISELFNLIDIKFWIRTPPYEIQALLAVITTALAEAIDERKLNQLMVPVVRMIVSILSQFCIRTSE